MPSRSPTCGGARPELGSTRSDEGSPTPRPVPGHGASAGRMVFVDRHGMVPAKQGRLTIKKLGRVTRPQPQPQPPFFPSSPSSSFFLPLLQFSFGSFSTLFVFLTSFSHTLSPVGRLDTNKWSGLLLCACLPLVGMTSSPSLAWRWVTGWTP
jgi:hypothetical protein